MDDATQEIEESQYNAPGPKDLFLSYQGLPGYNYRDVFFELTTDLFGWVFPINPITRGSTQGQRIGDSIRLLGFELFFGSVLDNTVTAGFSRQLRMLAVLSKAGKWPQIGDILSGPLTRLAPYNLQNVPNEYQILWDYALPAQFLDSVNTNKGEFFYKYILADHTIRFPKTGQTPTSENIQGNVFFLMLSNVNSTIREGLMRVHYTD